jgi:hypothetical protein
MAFTVLASWDFRGADSAATKRGSRVGSYTLTESGTPTYSTAGVDCSASSGNRLTLTLPAELKVSPLWLMVNFQVMNATAPAEFTNIAGIQFSNTSADLYDGTLMLCRKPANTSVRSRLITDGSTTTDAGVTLGTGSDHVVTLRRSGVNNPAIGIRVNSDAWDGNLNTSNQLDFSATSRLIIGSPTTDNSRCRYAWIMLGSGALDDSEDVTIRASPDTYLYGLAPSGTAAQRARYRKLCNLTK